MPVLVLETSWMLPDGRAAGRTPDGRVLRYSGSLPGDLVEVSPLSEKGHADADLVRIVEPSPGRIPAICPHSASCGGCDLDGLTAPVRQRALVQMVKHALHYEPVAFVPSPRLEAHRARITLAIEGGRLGYKAARSHTLVPVSHCRIARPEVEEARAKLAHWLAVDPARGDGLSSVEIRSDGTRAVYAFNSSGRASRQLLAPLGDVAVDGKTVSGRPVLELQVDGLSLRASPSSFYQVNLEIDTLLVEHVASTLLAHKVERVLDLYAGIGNLGLPIARRGLPVVSVEMPGPASEDLRHNARQLEGMPGAGRTEVLAAKVERFDPSRTAFDAVVLDPPRAGAEGMLARVVRNRPRVVVYVSCFAPSAARDIRELKGYDIVSVTVFDMFPDTHHTETVVILTRR